MNEPRVPSPESRANRLVHETSPYLQQHAHNPVDWYPWSEEALARAREENKPILLSIGYSACHWCHVMAHESFEDADTAEVMNRHFINVKVDREERPDLDRVYQTAQQLLTQRQGGWPLTMFLSPDNHVPFFGGTYFPPEPRYGLPGFRDMLEHVAGVYQNDQEAIHKQNAAFLEAMARIQDAPGGGCPDELDLEPVRKGVEGLLDFFDDVNGGFGGAPKFPQAPALELLLQYPCLDGGETGARAREAFRLTLEKMAGGGIYDHLGGGFCRYAVDARWMIPHFEKMLYDNGPLLGLYAQAWHVTGDEAFRKVARETADWIIRDMQAPAGGYYSSLDADSEGHEGKFYTWTREEVESLLDGDEYHVFAARYGLDGPPNFEGKWHLHVTAELAQVAAANAISPAEAAELIEGARNKLRKTREARIWPGRDEKILTSWNALAIRGMAIASLRLGEEQYLDSAERALTFIRDHMWRDGRLLASSKDGRGHLNAYLDDYAFLLEAILTLLGVRWNGEWFNFARDVSGVLLQQFHDPEHGGFYFTSHDHETLLQRRRDFMDDSTPSGNGVAARALMTLGHLTGDHKLLEVAHGTLEAAWSSMQGVAHVYPGLLLALANSCSPPRQVVIRGPEREIRVWQAGCYGAADVRTGVYAIPDGETGLPGALADRKAGDRPVAYLCEGFSCKPPYHSLEGLCTDLKQRAGE